MDRATGANVMRQQGSSIPVLPRRRTDRYGRFPQRDPPPPLDTSREGLCNVHFPNGRVTFASHGDMNKWLGFYRAFYVAHYPGHSVLRLWRRDL